MGREAIACFLTIFGVVVLVRPETVYCAFHDPSDVDCRRQDQTWIIRVAKARQANGHGAMDMAEPRGQTFQPATFRLIHPNAGRKILAFSAYEALNALRPLANSGLTVPLKAFERLQQEVLSGRDRT